MSDTKKILEHIAELYVKPKSDEDLDTAVSSAYEKLAANFEKYDEVFRQYLTADVIKAVDEYWRWKSDKVRPTLAQILGMLGSSNNVEKRDNAVFRADTRTERDIRGMPAFDFYEDDVLAAKRGQKADIPAYLFYKRAFDKIIAEDLPEVVGYADFSRMNRVQKYQAAMVNRLFTGITDKARALRNEAVGHYKAPVKQNIDEMIGDIGSHFRVAA